MEHFFESFLHNLGYKHIGIIDAEKKIWGYAKDGAYHFCKENLVEVDRKEIEIDTKVLVLTETSEKIEILEDMHRCSNYFIIDDSNNILRERSSYNGSSIYQMWRINSNSIVVGQKYSSSKRYETLQDVIINGEEEFDYVLSDTINNLFVFTKVFDLDNPVEGPEYKIYSNRECVHEGEYIYTWKHKNGDIHIFLTNPIDEKREALYIICSSPSDYYKKTIEIPYLHNCNLVLYRIELFTDNYLIIPYDDHGVLIVKYGEHYYNITTYTIEFKKDGFPPHYFSDNIITRELGWYVMNERHEEGFEFYDIFGNYLELLKDPLKSYGYYYIFTVPNKCLFHKIEKLYGVLEIRSDRCERVIIPPVFEHIEELSDELFKVRYGNFLEDYHHHIEYLYSITEGIIAGVPIELDYGIHVGRNNIGGKSWSMVPYTENGKVGLLYRGKKMLDTCFDDIQGFSYFFDTYTKEIGEEERTKLESYSPNSVVIKKDGKYGLFIGNYSSFLPMNVLIPEYDRIECINVVFEKKRNIYNTYFEVKKGDCVSIISDYDIRFNSYNLDKYDKIEAINWCFWCAMFKVYKEGKVGVISSLGFNNNDICIIPIKFKSLTMEWIGRKQHYLYCGDGIYYTDNEIELLSKDNYSFEGADSIGECYIFKNRNNDEYHFYNIVGKKLIISKIEDCDNLLLVNSKHKFDIIKGEFLPPKEEDDDDSDDYYDYLREEEERRFYENEGYRDAYDGNPEALWNTD